MKYREELGKMVQKITTIPLPNTSVMPLIDYEVNILFLFIYQCFVLYKNAYMFSKLKLYKRSCVLILIHYGSDEN